MNPTATPINLTLTDLQHLMLMTQITLAVGVFTAGVLVTRTSFITRLRPTRRSRTA